MSILKWNERIPMLSVNPDAATCDDVAKLASDLMACRHELDRLRFIVGDIDSNIINELLDGQDA